MLMTKVQKLLLEILEQFGAIRTDQADKLLRLRYPHIDLEKTLFPLLSAHKIVQSRGYIFAPCGKLRDTIIEAIDIMLLINPDPGEPYLRGIEPFALTFFKHRKDKLWRYDICPLPSGAESVVSVRLEGINAKYRMIIFVPEHEDQMQSVTVSCEHGYAIKTGDNYNFYICKMKGE